MTRRVLPLLVALVAALQCSRPALAGTVNIGVITYDVVGTNLAEFDIFNGTGINSSAFPDPTFPVTTSVALNNASLTLFFTGGAKQVFGPSYFTLDADGISLDGTARSTIEAAPNGIQGLTEAIFTANVTPTLLTLNSGITQSFNPSVTAVVFGSGPSGIIEDGDFAVITDSTPEPSPLILASTGLLTLLLFRRRLVPARAKTSAAAIGLGILLLAARSGDAQSVKLSAFTAPDSGATGVTAVNITGSGFPSGTIPAANVALTVAPSCGSAGTLAQVNSVTKIIGTSERVQFVIPGALSSATYFVSLSGTTSTGTGFASSNCAEVNVTGASPVASISTTSIAFASLTAGTSSPTQTFNLTNTGTAALNISNIAVTGPQANLFSASSNCPPSLAVGNYCTVTAGFNPKIMGSYSAAVTITDNASPVSQSVALSGSATPAVLTIDTSNASDWKINNGALSLDFNPSKGRIFGIYLAGYPDDLVDTTNGNEGIYMDNSGFGTGTNTYSYVNAGTYLDWWVTTASNSANAYTYTMHFVVYPNDPGIHTYFVANHSTTDIAGGIGQVQWVYRSNLNDFPNTYSVNPDLSNPGPITVPLPPASENFSTDPGRAVSDATVDLHGFTLPVGFTREFYTKYDYSSYNYLHQAHGTFGSTFGTWAYFPSNESLVAGPTKQNLIFTGNLLILEAYSNHLDNELALATPKGIASSRLFGPYYIHFNTFGQAYTSTGNMINTPDDMYADTLQAGASFVPLYDSEQQLLQNGYVPSTSRGSVSIQVNGVTGSPKTAWAVLSDPKTNHELSSQGYQYWADISNGGTATFNGVVPGTYRLSVYVLGQFGELRQDGITVLANQNTIVPAVTFVPENFGGETVFTIGTPDRSSHEFLHGHDAQGHDDREFFGTWNYWADFAANNGSVIYNATSGPAGAATNDLSKWNYDHWGVFDPGLYGGVYVSNDDTTDGYKYVLPSYVASVTTRTPSWTVHFASPSDVATYQTSGFAVLSISMACNFGSYVITLNGTSSSHTRTWSFSSSTESDCAVRSGLSGYTQWVAFQFPASFLNPPGADNVITLGVSQTYGVMDDALRLELTNTSAAPATTGWNDYEFVGTSSSSANVHANDSLANP